MDGRPLAGATVLFRPLETGSAAFGHSDANGRFRLLFSKNEPGVLPGHYQVQITTSGTVTESGGFASAETVPTVYNERSTLYREIKKDTTEVALELLSDADVNQGLRRGRRPAPGRFVNIVLIVADGMGPEWLGCYGGEGAATPNIDALAASGMTFRNAYSMPDRAAARVTLLTGEYPFRHGWVGDWDVPRSGRGCWFDWDEYRTVARRLSEGDFVTSIVGQWQLNDFRRQPDALLQHGFGRWCVWPGAEHGNPASSHQFRDPYVYLNRPLQRNMDGWPDRNIRQYDWGGAGTFANKLGPDVFTHFVKSTVSRRTSSPQFVYYPMTLPSASSPAANGFDDNDERGQADRNRQHRELVQYTDRLVGELVERLNSANQRARTVVIFTSDGGSPRGVASRRNGRDVPGGRGSLSERGVHVPLIVSCPGIIATGGVTDSLVDLTDLSPTICELARLPMNTADAAGDGRSFAPLLLGEPDQEPRAWIMAMGAGELEFDGQRLRGRTPFAERVLRDQRYKVHVNTQRQIDALYDLDADASEQQNLIDSGAPEHVEAVGRFQAVVESFPAEDAQPRYSPLLDGRGPRTTAAPATASEPAS